VVYFDNFGIMKKIGNKTAWLSTFLLTLASLFTACSSDDVAEQGGGRPAQGMAKVTLRIATDNADGGKASTRAWQDANNAKTDRTEMMYSWHVVLVDASNKVVFKKSRAEVDEGNAEIDVVENNLELAAGTYTAYSFANVDDGSLPDANISVGGTLSPTTMTDATFTVNGNGFIPSAGNGIPMSNKQTLTIAPGDTEKDLIVVRMLAKITLSVKNGTGAEQYIKYATISNVTANVANNLKLLPTLTYKDDMEAHHADIRPNLNGTPKTVELAIPNLATTEALANDATREVTFYINECKTGTDFNLTIGLGDATNTNEYRYALIDSKGATTADDDKWDYIARNDYRIIPIVLDDYRFEIIPYDFPPIGVYPVSVSEIDNVNHIYNFTFHDYGHFHLLPKVTKGTSTQVKYNVGTGDYWTLDTDFAGSWNTAATKGGTWLDDTGITSNGFYRNETATADADEAGGVPVWYANTSSPQWDPAGGSDYQPFIFGYIADPGEELAADKKIYHEMKIKLYVGGAYRRDMIYRFYMTLSKDQMSYSRGDVTPGGSRGLGVERPRLPHNHIWK